PAFIRSLNTVGLSRAGFDGPARLELKRVYKALYRSGKTVRAAIDEIDPASLTPPCRELIEFYGTSKRGVASFAPYRRDRGGEDE
ncbi:acyl-[acyl-carrier-protein]--UDP-N-acetylglucosamine O-acyltransferase, partial [Candidatus Sumerlaeota bacterium]|nr:acyl-[acyl-carrier-protein]--UDP-N-acetylglucosamine O-acyltransferase [Candidatus Sumerlaeota bacterium]